MSRDGHHSGPPKPQPDAALAGVNQPETDSSRASDEQIFGVELHSRAQREPHKTGVEEDAAQEAAREELELQQQDPARRADAPEAKRKRARRQYEKHKKRGQREQKNGPQAAGGLGHVAGTAGKLSAARPEEALVRAWFLGLPKFGAAIQRARTHNALIRAVCSEALRRANEALPEGPRSALQPLVCLVSGHPLPAGFDQHDQATAKRLQRAVADGLVPAMRAACEEAAADFPARDPRRFALLKLAQGLQATTLEEERRALTPKEIEQALAAAAGQAGPAEAKGTRGPTTEAVFEGFLTLFAIEFNHQEALLRQAQRHADDLERKAARRARENERKRKARSDQKSGAKSRGGKRTRGGENGATQ